jgi:hypothetical protein
MTPEEVDAIYDAFFNANGLEHTTCFPIGVYELSHFAQFFYNGHMFDSIEYPDMNPEVIRDNIEGSYFDRLTTLIDLLPLFPFFNRLDVFLKKIEPKQPYGIFLTIKYEE